MYVHTLRQPQIPPQTFIPLLALSKKDLFRQLEAADTKSSGIVQGSLVSGSKVSDINLICKALHLETIQ